MLGEQRSLALAKKILAYSKADQTEVVLTASDSALTRFANSFIHQNVAEKDSEARVRVVVGKKIGVAATNDVSDAGLRQVVESAMTIAKFQQDNPDFVSLPAPAAPYGNVDAYVERTARVTPRQRAQSVGVICKKSIDAGVTGSGALRTAVFEITVANSLGVAAHFATTRSDLTTVVMSDTGSGYAGAAALDFADFDFEALADEAVQKAVKSRNPIAIEPGEYTVILEEYAVSDMVEFLGRLGCTAQAMQEGRSFMKLGQKVVGDNVSIWDDGTDAGALPLPFDFEGVPKARLPLIEKGIARNVVYDSYTAGKEGRKSTGHALPAPSAWGPLPVNLFLGTGSSSKDEMLRSTKKGIWVTRFHYTRPVHPLKVIITGMTRDGTFLIENGEITRPVKNLRFTQGYLDALSDVELMSSNAKTIADDYGAMTCTRVPALKIGKFMFTGATEF